MDDPGEQHPRSPLLDTSRESPVDLHTAKSLSRYFRDEVLAEAEVQYAQV